MSSGLSVWFIYLFCHEWVWSGLLFEVISCIVGFESASGILLFFYLLFWIDQLFYFISLRNILFVHLFLFYLAMLGLVVACGTRIKSGPLALGAWGLSYLLGHQRSPSFHLFCWLLVVHFVLLSSESHSRSQRSLARGNLPRQPRMLVTLHPLSPLTASCCHRLAPAERYTVVSILASHKFRLSEKLHKHQNFLHTLIYSPERVGVSLSFSLDLEDPLGFSQRSAYLCIQATLQSLLGPQPHLSPGLVRSLVWSWALVSVAWRGGWPASLPTVTRTEVAGAVWRSDLPLRSASVGGGAAGRTSLTLSPPAGAPPPLPAPSPSFIYYHTVSSSHSVQEAVVFFSHLGSSAWRPSFGNCWRVFLMLMILVHFCLSESIFYFKVLFEGYFHWVYNSKLTVFFFHHFKDHLWLL